MDKKRFPLFFKYLLDKLFALLFLIISLPLFLLVILSILLSDGRPVFFRQMRPGFKEKPFTLYKFKTMRDLKNTDGKNLPDNDRLTEVGKIIRKLSIDEPKDLKS